MATIYNDTLNAVGTNLLAHTSDSGNTYSAIVIGSTTLETAAIVIDANGLPEVSGSASGGALINGLTLPSTFTVISNFLYSGGSSGIGWIINYDPVAHTGLLLNIEPNGGRLALYEFNYASGSEFNFGTAIATATFSFVATTSYPLAIYYNAGAISVSFGGANLSGLNYTDTYSTGHVAGIRVSAASTPADGHLNSLQITNTPLATIYADNPGLLYIGPWSPVQGSGSGSYAFALSNSCEIWARLDGTTTCVVNFDTSLCGTGQYSDVIVEIDGAEGARTTLTSGGTINGVFPTIEGVGANDYTDHFLKIKMASIFDGTSSMWTLASGITKFTGLSLESGGTLLPIYGNAAQIAAFGDSITNGENLLGINSLATQQAANLNWFKRACDMLGFAPVGYGYSGAGLVKSGLGTSSTQCGVPLFSGSFGYCANGIAIRSITPQFILFAYGTNDHGQSVAQSTFQVAYLAALQQVGMAYPNAYIVPMILPQMALTSGPGSYSANVIAAVTAFGSAKCPVGNILDVSNSFLTGDFSDGLHLNLGGAVKMAGIVAAKIQSLISGFGLQAYCAAGGGGSASPAEGSHQLSRHGGR